MPLSLSFSLSLYIYTEDKKFVTTLHFLKKTPQEEIFLYFFKVKDNISVSIVFMLKGEYFLQFCLNQML